MEELEGVVVDYVSRRSGKTQGDGFEVVEDFAIGVVNRTVAFIDNDEIEKSGAIVAVIRPG